MSSHAAWMRGRPGDTDLSEPELASLGDRFVAQLLDALISGIIFVGLLPLAVATEGYGVAILIWGFVHYRFLCDGYTGRSLGKRPFRLQVLEAKTLKACGLWRSLARNFLLYCCLGFFDAVFILGKRRQRLGDMLAGTIVVKVPKGESFRTLPQDVFVQYSRKSFHIAVAIGVALLAAYGLRARYRSDVFLFNGLPVAVEIQLGESSYELTPGESYELSAFKAGSYPVSTRTLDGELLEEFTFSVPPRYDIVAYNVLGGAPLFLEEEVYVAYDVEEQVECPEPTFVDLAGKRTVLRRSADFVLEPSPDEVPFVGAGGYRLTMRFDVDAGGWETSLSTLVDMSWRGDDLRRLATAIVRLSGEDDELAVTALSILTSISDQQLFEDVATEAVERHPRSVDLHRIRQDQLLWWGEVESVRSTYGKLLTENPESPLFGYLDARAAPHGESLERTEELLARFPDDPHLLTRHGWALHQAGEFDSAQVHLERALELQEAWTLELIEPATRNLVALDRVDAAMELATEFAKRPESSSPEFALLFSQLHNVRGGPFLRPLLVRTLRDSFDIPDWDPNVWVQLAAGADVLEEPPLDATEGLKLRNSLLVARALERDPVSALSVLEEIEEWNPYALGPQRVVALACAALHGGDGETAESLLQEVWIPWHVLDDSVLGAAPTPYTPELPWEVRAILELFAGMREPAGSSARAEHFERARMQDFMRGLAYRAVERW